MHVSNLVKYDPPFSLLHQEPISDFGIMPVLVPIVKILGKNGVTRTNFTESGVKSFRGSDKRSVNFSILVTFNIRLLFLKRINRQNLSGCTEKKS